MLKINIILSYSSFMLYPVLYNRVSRGNLVLKLFSSPRGYKNVSLRQVRIEPTAAAFTDDAVTYSPQFCVFKKIALIFTVVQVRRRRGVTLHETGGYRVQLWRPRRGHGADRTPLHQRLHACVYTVICFMF